MIYCMYILFTSCSKFMEVSLMDDPDTVSSILLILGLLLINAFFAAAEMAIVSVNKKQNQLIS